MNFSDERDDRRQKKPEPGADEVTGAAPASGRKKRGGGSEVGHALRSAYQRTLDETIPPEMLDLLGKLG